MKEKYKFLTNTVDPTHPIARMYYCFSFHARISGQEACDREWQHHLDYINDHITGRPRTSEKYTREQAEADHMIGVYAND